MLRELQSEWEDAGLSPSAHEQHETADLSLPRLARIRSTVEHRHATAKEQLGPRLEELEQLWRLLDTPERERTAWRDLVRTTVESVHTLTSMEIEVANLRIEVEPHVGRVARGLAMVWDELAIDPLDRWPLLEAHVWSASDVMAGGVHLRVLQRTILEGARMSECLGHEMERAVEEERQAAAQALLNRRSQVNSTNELSQMLDERKSKMGAMNRKNSEDENDLTRSIAIVSIRKASSVTVSTENDPAIPMMVEWEFETRDLAEATLELSKTREEVDRLESLVKRYESELMNEVANEQSLKLKTLHHLDAGNPRAASVSSAALPPHVLKALMPKPLSLSKTFSSPNLFIEGGNEYTKTSPSAPGTPKLEAPVGRQTSSAVSKQIWAELARTRKQLKAAKGLEGMAARNHSRKFSRWDAKRISFSLTDEEWSNCAEMHKGLVAMVGAQVEDEDAGSTGEGVKETEITIKSTTNSAKYQEAIKLAQEAAHGAMVRAASETASAIAEQTMLHHLKSVGRAGSDGALDRKRSFKHSDAARGEKLKGARSDSNLSRMTATTPVQSCNSQPGNQQLSADRTPNGKSRFFNEKLKADQKAQENKALSRQAAWRGGKLKITTALALTLKRKKSKGRLRRLSLANSNSSSSSSPSSSSPSSSLNNEIDEESDSHSSEEDKLDISLVHSIGSAHSFNEGEDVDFGNVADAVKRKGSWRKDKLSAGEKRRDKDVKPKAKERKSGSSKSTKNIYTKQDKRKERKKIKNRERKVHKEVKRQNNWTKGKQEKEGKFRKESSGSLPRMPEDEIEDEIEDESESELGKSRNGKSLNSTRKNSHRSVSQKSRSQNLTEDNSHNSEESDSDHDDEDDDDWDHDHEEDEEEDDEEDDNNQDDDEGLHEDEDGSVRPITNSKDSRTRRKGMISTLPNASTHSVTSEIPQNVGRQLRRTGFPQTARERELIASLDQQEKDNKKERKKVRQLRSRLAVYESQTPEDSNRRATPKQSLASADTSAPGKVGEEEDMVEELERKLAASQSKVHALKGRVDALLNKIPAGDERTLWTECGAMCRAMGVSRRQVKEVLGVDLASVQTCTLEELQHGVVHLREQKRLLDLLSSFGACIHLWKQLGVSQQEQDKVIDGLFVYDVSETSVVMDHFNDVKNKLELRRSKVEETKAEIVSQCAVMLRELGQPQFLEDIKRLSEDSCTEHTVELLQKERFRLKAWKKISGMDERIKSINDELVGQMKTATGETRQALKGAAKSKKDVIQQQQDDLENKFGRAPGTSRPKSPRFFIKIRRQGAVGPASNTLKNSVKQAMSEKNREPSEGSRTNLEGIEENVTNGGLSTASSRLAKRRAERAARAIARSNK